MITALFVFALLMLLNCGLTAVAIGAIFIRNGLHEVFSRSELTLYTFALGPGISSLFLWYVLVTLHGVSGWVPVLLYAVLIVGTLLVNRPYAAQYMRAVRSLLWPFKAAETERTRITIEAFGARLSIHGEKLLLLVAIGWFIHWWLERVLTTPINSHDMLEYAIQAKVFAKDMAIRYVDHRYDADSMFYYVGLHGFSFPLLGTWEGIWDQLTGIRSDFFFRAMSGYYGLLTLGIVYTWTRRRNRVVAAATIGFLFLVFGFFTAIRGYHIDAMRINGILLSFIFFGYLLYTKERKFALLLAMGLGLSATIHSMNCIIGIMALGLAVLLLKLPLKQRAGWALMMGAAFLAFGAVHYVLDVLIGTGWIFQSIQYY